MSSYYTEREKLRGLCSNSAAFNKADRALFFTQVKAKLKELKLKVERFIYYEQISTEYDCFELEGSVPWQHKTKKYLHKLALFDTWLKDVLCEYNNYYVSRDCDTLIVKWEIDLVNYTLSNISIEFKMAHTNTTDSIGYTIETELTFDKTPNLISKDLFKTKAFISLLKYKDPRKAWAQIKEELAKSLQNFKAEPVWYELQGEVDRLPKWDLSLCLPLRNIGEWLAERYEGALENENPPVTFIFKN